MTVLKRTGEAKVAFIPSEEWVEAFTCQIADAHTYAAMKMYAVKRGRLIAHLRKLDPEAFGIELVQDIIDDTLEGRIAWDPAKVTLRKHVLDAVKSRSRHAYRKALQQKHVALDEGGERLLEQQAALQTLETEAHLAERKRAMNAIFAVIRERAKGDVEVQLLLDAYERGAEERASVLALGTLTTLQYDAARKRLDRSIEALPNQLLSTALRSR